MTLTTALATFLLPFLAWSSVPSQVPSGSHEIANLALVGIELSNLDDGGEPPGSTGAGWSYSYAGEWTVSPGYADLRGWHDFAVEFWPASAIQGRPWVLASGPAIRVDMPVTRDGVALTVSAPHARELTWWAVFVVARNAIGERVILDGGQIRRLPAWRGTVLDWWLGR